MFQRKKRRNSIANYTVACLLGGVIGLSSAYMLQKNNRDQLTQKWKKQLEKLESKLPRQSQHLLELGTEWTEEVSDILKKKSPNHTLKDTTKKPEISQLIQTVLDQS
ncbi:hypothetical protein BTS2_0786 [Bacillus sp. TS-2]|nr:hypothetical protein BTS2_0786 [Bacillus sp. TS-2]